MDNLIISDKTFLGLIFNAEGEGIYCQADY